MTEQHLGPKVTVSGQVRKEVVLEGDGIRKVVAVKCRGCPARGFFRVASIIDGVVQELICYPIGDGDERGKGACGALIKTRSTHGVNGS